jgi:hypothetical protein
MRLTASQRKLPPGVLYTVTTTRFSIIHVLMWHQHLLVAVGQMMAAVEEEAVDTVTVVAVVVTQAEVVNLRFFYL